MFNNHAGKPVFLNKETLLRSGVARFPALVQIHQSIFSERLSIEKTGQ